MARLILPALLVLALASCGKPSDVAGTEDATVNTAAALDPKAAAEAEKAKKLSDALAAQKTEYDAAKIANDVVKLDDLADAGNGFALFDRANVRLASQDYMMQQGGFQDMELAAEKGVSGAQLWVGQRMAFGKEGYKLQPNSGLKMMEKAAAQGNLDAILAVASMYAQDAYMHDQKQAREWYKRGADLGSDKAKDALKQMDEAAGGSPLSPQ